MFEFATWFALILRSFLIVKVNNGGKAYLGELLYTTKKSVEHSYHDRNATMNPNQVKKKVRPYLSNGFRIGMDLALRLIGLTTGAVHSWDGLNGMFATHSSANR